MDLYFHHILSFFVKIRLISYYGFVFLCYGSECKRLQDWIYTTCITYQRSIFFLNGGEIVHVLRGKSAVTRSIKQSVVFICTTWYRLSFLSSDEIAVSYQPNFPSHLLHSWRRPRVSLNRRLYGPQFQSERGLERRIPVGFWHQTPVVQYDPIHFNLPEYLYDNFMI